MLVNCNEILKKMIAEHNLNLHSVVILITALADRFCWLSLAIVYLKMVCCLFVRVCCGWSANIWRGGAVTARSTKETACSTYRYEETIDNKTAVAFWIIDNRKGLLPIRPALISGFLSMKRLGVFLIPLDEMLVHRYFPWLYIFFVLQDLIELVGKSWDRNWFYFHKSVSLEWYLVSNVFQVDIMLHQEFTNLAVLYLWLVGPSVGIKMIHFLIHLSMCASFFISM